MSITDTNPKLWHAVPAENVLTDWKTGLSDGLDSTIAAQRLVEFGRNELTRNTGPGPLTTFLLQFHQPLVYILLAATAVTFFLEEYIDAGVILGVVLVNGVVGFLQEYRAAKAIDALAKSLKASATVFRSGKALRLSSAELVPGDLVILQSGDQVPADLRLVRVKDLRCAEAALTGESLPVSKVVEPLPPETALADRTNMAFATTLVTHGQATGVVVATGDRTEVGKIQRLIRTAEDLETPLTREIARFSHWLMYTILTVAAFTFVVGLVQGQSPVDLFHGAVALSVAAIPEGLPAAVTVVLAIGVARMARRNAIIRKLPAVEALGATSIICSDKTGTLTENQMTVQRIWAQGRSWTVTGVGYSPQGEFVPDDDSENHQNQSLWECLRCGALCNDSRLIVKEGRYEIDGDPTECALIVAARKAGIKDGELPETDCRLDTIPFDSEFQYMATLHDRGEGHSRVIYLKGSVERILDRCADAPQEEIHRIAGEMGASGLRVLAFASKEIPAHRKTLERSDVSDGLTFLGLQGMVDPPRPEALKAVMACQTAGVGVKMITGDHATTAAAIATQLGIIRGSETTGKSLVLTGSQLETTSDRDLAEVAERVDVFARVNPEQKLRLVKALQTGGRIVAMTGDGVNDAPALKQADIGVAMGLNGTEVAKDAADMVLTDDNFASIVAAVEEGRGVFDNLTKFLVWTLPTNLGEGLVIVLAVLLGTTLPILPVQILWINMTTAVFLGMTLTFEPKEPGLMSRPPRKQGQSFLSPELLRRMVLVGIAMLGGAFGLFHYELNHAGTVPAAQAEAMARTVAVNVFVMVEVFYLFNCRCLLRTAFATGFWGNPWAVAGAVTMTAFQILFTYAPFMNEAFHSAPISATAWVRILAIAGAVFLFVDLETLWTNRKPPVSRQ